MTRSSTQVTTQITSSNRLHWITKTVLRADRTSLSLHRKTIHCRSRQLWKWLSRGSQLSSSAMRSLSTWLNAARKRRSYGRLGKPIYATVGGLERIHCTRTYLRFLNLVSCLLVSGQKLSERDTTKRRTNRSTRCMRCAMQTLWQVIYQRITGWGTWLGRSSTWKPLSTLCLQLRKSGTGLDAIGSLVHRSWLSGSALMSL